MGALVLLETEQVSFKRLPTEAASCFSVKRDKRLLARPWGEPKYARKSNKRYPLELMFNIIMHYKQSNRDYFYSPKVR